MQEKSAACSWSSGKDSCLALYKVLQAGYQIKYLFNFISRQYGRVSFHGIKNNLVQLQSEALGIPLIQRETTENNYEEVFRNTLAELKGMGINKVVRGNIYLQDLQDWVLNICASEGMDVVSPIWHRPTQELLKEFVECGFKAIVTSAQANKLDERWIGRIIDERLIDELKEIKNVDLCGENGEYHSFVYDGPIFSKEIQIIKTEKVLIKEYWFLDIQEYKLVDKKERR